MRDIDLTRVFKTTHEQNEPIGVTWITTGQPMANMVVDVTLFNRQTKTFVSNRQLVVNAVRRWRQCYPEKGCILHVTNENEKKL